MGDQEIIIELREMGFANKEQKFEAEKIKSNCYKLLGVCFVT
jgi:hypothetical protein